MESDTWHLTILLLSGLRLMRPEKGWRPIVTVEVDAHNEEGAHGARAGGVYETLLGVDGQCVNQRDGMTIYHASPNSKLNINVWHRSQSKKKKRRILVASSTCCLGELAKKREGADGKLDLRLICRSTDTKGGAAARGRPQNGAVLRIKLRPPPKSSSLRPPQIQTSSWTDTLRPGSGFVGVGIPSRSSTLDTVYTDDSHVSSEIHIHIGDAAEENARAASPVPDVESKSSVDSEYEEESLLLTSPVDEQAWFGEDTDPITSSNQPKQVQPSTLRRRRRVKPFSIDTDDECQSYSESETESVVSEKPREDDDGHNNSDTFVDDDDDLSRTPLPSHLTLSLTHQKHTTEVSDEFVFKASTGEIISFSSTTTGTGEKIWISAARDVLLPMYTKEVVVPPQKMGLISRALCSFTLYGELDAATESEAQFEPVARKLQNEWAVVGTLLLALAGVNTAMFTVDGDGMFTVNDYAKSAIALSSVSSGLGIACAAWFFLRYNWADTPTFMSRSRDVFDGHTFFALSSRVPALCMFISALSITTCLALIAFSTFPGGVLVLCFLVGILMSLQFIVFGVRWLGQTVVTGGRAGSEKVRGAVRRITASTTTVA